MNSGKKSSLQWREWTPDLDEALLQDLVHDLQKVGHEVIELRDGGELLVQPFVLVTDGMDLWMEGRQRRGMNSFRALVRGRPTGVADHVIQSRCDLDHSLIGFRRQLSTAQEQGRSRGWMHKAAGHERGKQKKKKKHCWDDGPGRG